MSLSSPSSVVIMNNEEPPVKKNKKASLVRPHITISSLPDDLLLSCFARVTRLYYQTLSLVSKKFRLLIASPELYEARSLLNRRESCLYVCLRFDRNSDPLWFTLCKKPNRNLTNDTTKKKTIQEKSSGYVLATIPILNSPPLHSRGLVTVGSNIYAIGSCDLSPLSCDSAPRSSRVSILDCRSHTWHEGPSMQVERRYANAYVFDGKIYVAGGCDFYDDSSKWMEVFDPKIKTWESVLCPVAKICQNQISKSAVIDGKIDMLLNSNCVAYKPKEDKWEDKSRVLRGGLYDIEYISSYCVIDNILYCYRHLQGIQWYDSNVKQWMDLLSLDELPKIYKYCSVQLVCYGGKMVVLCDKNLGSGGSDDKKMTIWCAVIALEKRENYGEIWGVVESVDDDVLTVPSSYKYVCALEATL